MRRLIFGVICGSLCLLVAVVLVLIFCRATYGTRPSRLPLATSYLFESDRANPGRLSCFNRNFLEVSIWQNIADQSTAQSQASSSDL